MLKKTLRDRQVETPDRCSFARTRDFYQRLVDNTFVTHSKRLSVLVVTFLFVE